MLKSVENAVYVVLAERGGIRFEKTGIFSVKQSEIIHSLMSRDFQLIDNGVSISRILRCELFS